MQALPFTSIFVFKNWVHHMTLKVIIKVEEAGDVS
jgi:hypothetical protein